METSLRRLTKKRSITALLFHGVNYLQRYRTGMLVWSADHPVRGTAASYRRAGAPKRHPLAHKPALRRALGLSPTIDALAGTVLFV